MYRRLLPLVVLAAACCTGPQQAAGAPAATVSLAARPAPAAGDSLRWIGGPTALIERGGLCVITDPMLGPRGPNAFVLPKHPSTGAANAPIARYTSPAAVPLEALDAILISHTHADHLDARAQELLPKKLPLVVAAAGADVLRAHGFEDVRPLDWGESTTIEARGTRLRVLAVPAHHAHDPELDRSLGRGNGYLLDWSDPRGTYRVYWTGDAVLADETRQAREQYGHIDLLLPHLGGVGGDGALGLRTMNAEEALELVRRLSPSLVVPIHHTTFGHYREPIEALAQRADESHEAASFRFLREGESLALLP
jgi:L-ascorbate metabolism protein UlaG (beta-lactamase superfamily)